MSLRGEAAVCTPSDSLTHSKALQLKAAFPRGSAWLVKPLLLIQKNQTLLILQSALSCTSPALRNQTPMFLTTHQSTNKIVSALFLFSRLPRLLTQTSVSCHVWEDVGSARETWKLEVCAVYFVRQVGPHKAAPEVRNCNDVYHQFI